MYHSWTNIHELSVINWNNLISVLFQLLYLLEQFDRCIFIPCRSQYKFRIILYTHWNDLISNLSPLEDPLEQSDILSVSPYRSIGTIWYLFLFSPVDPLEQSEILSEFPYRSIGTIWYLFVSPCISIGTIWYLMCILL